MMTELNNSKLLNASGIRVVRFLHRNKYRPLHCQKDFAHFRSHKRVPPARFEPQAEICFQICTLHPAEICPFLGAENESCDKEIESILFRVGLDHTAIDFDYCRSINFTIESDIIIQKIAPYKKTFFPNNIWPSFQKWCTQDTQDYTRNEDTPKYTHFSKNYIFG